VVRRKAVFDKEHRRDAARIQEPKLSRTAAADSGASLPELRSCRPAARRPAGPGARRAPARGTAYNLGPPPSYRRRADLEALADLEGRIDKELKRSDKLRKKAERIRADADEIVDELLGAVVGMVKAPAHWSLTGVAGTTVSLGANT